MIVSISYLGTIYMNLVSYTLTEDILSRLDFYIVIMSGCVFRNLKINPPKTRRAGKLFI